MALYELTTRFPPEPEGMRSLCPFVTKDPDSDSCVALKILAEGTDLQTISYIAREYFVLLPLFDGGKFLLYPCW